MMNMCIGSQRNFFVEVAAMLTELLRYPADGWPEFQDILAALLAEIACLATMADFWPVTLLFCWIRPRHLLPPHIAGGRRLHSLYFILYTL